MSALVVVPVVEPRLVLVEPEDTVHAQLARILEPYARRSRLRVVQGERGD